MAPDKITITLTFPDNTDGLGKIKVKFTPKPKSESARESADKIAETIKTFFAEIAQ